MRAYLRDGADERIGDFGVVLLVDGVDEPEDLLVEGVLVLFGQALIGLD